ncbi:MAG: rod shape-determining protein RodA [Nitrospirae bacterium GWC2_42_7]|nr:MAG: rod shape-determining protein RodA [Nitrospirae bacterium GWC2_42_7]
MFNIDRRLISNFDWITFSIVMTISLIGIMTIFSATRQPVESVQSAFFLKQLIWLVIGLAGMALFISFDYIWLSRFSVLLYTAGLVLLLIVLISGRIGMGAQRWISLGPLSFQPSEFFKLIFIVMLSRHLEFSGDKISISAVLKIFFIIVLLPFVFLFKQPDLGTAMVILILFVLMILAKGLHKKALVLILMISLLSLPFLGSIVWTGLKGYQKNRLIAFMDPGIDPSGIGYHIAQSKVAVGSGEFFGKGYLNGTQGPFRFLPEKHTDFIFAVFAEEWGFFGSVLLLSLYLFLIMRGLDTARKAKDEFGRLLALGITFMFSVYFFINVGMTLGIMPVVGIPLPFMSYGGTALLSNFISAGVLINIRTRRFSLFY